MLKMWRWLAAAVLLPAAGGGVALAANVHLPKGPGVNLVYAKCQTCHDLQYLTDSKGLLPAQWKSLITSMQDYGLEVNKQEKNKILSYLTTYLGPNPPPKRTTESAAKQKHHKVDGHTVFKQNCATCHGAKGRGQPGYFPPLAGNPDLSRDRVFPVLVVLNGLAGKIQVKDRGYSGSMPAFDHLSDPEIAAVVNFIRSAWGNSPAGLEALTPGVVAQQRKRSMSPAAVRAYRAKIH